ncbi:MAG: hypothetical protein OXU27_03295 [Candidatus Poribacteria bacterium]|nr:hypothetical protein [Candidatus Poribacteria bacterium]MDD9973001.1 hypothetical protein [Candidatus Poribacteria bacterium]MDE0323084.1 hypothetical protein [Candidatus Poribacteria bacterium]
MQNGCAARHIADVCRAVINGERNPTGEVVGSTQKQTPALA